VAQRKASYRDTEKCGVCDKGVGDKDSGIQCELREKWWHAGCVKISDDLYKVLNKMPYLHWFCELCNNSACKLLFNLAELNNRMENMKKKSDDLQGKVREMEQKTGELKKEVSNVNDRIDNFEKKYRVLKHQK